MNSLATLKTILFSMLVFTVGYGQDIKGKWIDLKDREALTYPSINVFEFKESKLVQYDFDKKIDSATYSIKGNSIYLGKTVKTFKFIGDNVLEITGPATINGRDSTMPTKYLRLEGTYYEWPKESIENKSFVLHWNNAKNIISFNNSHSTNDFQVSRFKSCSDIRLENLDMMLFLSVFCNNKRAYVFPIKKVTKNELILYANAITEIRAEINKPKKDY
ncbi:hypothetical protein [Maribacter sp. 2307ULW6-5]|uniref:hypothetical protein n=1 Tax=Maribacter sp. 2307ULW6-5 TaxID=3386275 RepID=UPI0039BC7573